MLSHRLSKILAEKNVPHDVGWMWGLPERYTEGGEPKSYVTDEHYIIVDDSKYDTVECLIPAYPEIALFKCAKLVWSKPGRGITEYSEPGRGGFTVTPKCTTCGEQFTQKQIDEIRFGHKNCPKAESNYKHHTHTLADLFSSGASEQEIGNYVLESLGNK